ncbi:MAG: hypothetical protein AAF495_10440 [Pseudomonadota bacterium]
MRPKRHRSKAPLPAALVAVALFVLGAPEAQAISFVKPDCADSATNTGCAHPNTVSLSGFRASAPDKPPVAGVSSLLCSGSLLDKTGERIVILSAGHCVSAYLAGLQDGSLVDVGVSFDALIARELPPPFSPASWSPTQYVLGGQPVLPLEYGSESANARSLHFDYAVIVYEIPPGGLVTQGGEPVDLSAIEPVNLPDEGFLDDLVSATDPALVTAVGYGAGQDHRAPGEGGRKGAPNDTSVFGVRFMAGETGLTHFVGPNRSLVFGAQNPARGINGSCGGGSGGPIFYDGFLGEIQVGVTSSGDAICLGSAIAARIDGTEAQEFLNCVLGASETAGIAECGCIEVDKQGACAL